VPHRDADQEQRRRVLRRPARQALDLRTVEVAHAEKRRYPQPFIESQGRVVFTSVQFTGTYGLEAQQVLGADIVPKLAIPMPW
jgi:hypothetical protein